MQVTMLVEYSRTKTIKKGQYPNLLDTPAR